MRRMILLWAALAGVMQASPAPERSMRQASMVTSLLSGLVDAKVVQFETPATGNAAPATGYSTVMMFDGVYWCYTPGLGTRSLGAITPNADTTAEITARFKKVAPDLGQVKVFSRTPKTGAAGPDVATLANGSFPSCLLKLTLLYANGDAVDEAGIIFLTHAPLRDLHGTAPLSDVGHGFLAYRSGNHWTIVDPSNPGKTLPSVSPTLETGIDSALLDYARDRQYAFSKAEYYSISAPSLKRLASNVNWNRPSSQWVGDRPQDLPPAPPAVLYPGKG